jgi:hypothetical protein
MLEQLKQTIGKKGSKVRIILAFIIAIGIIQGILWGYLEPYFDTIDISAKILKLICLITASICMAAFLLLFALWKMELLPKSTKHYCNISLNFDNDYPNFIFLKPKKDKSELWYILIKTREFDKTKESILRILKNETVNGNLSNNIELWSLLGESELLLKFRAHNVHGMAIHETLKKELTNNQLLENQSATSIIVIDIGQQLVRNLKDINGDLIGGDIIYQDKVNHLHRYTKIFVKFQFENNKLIASIVPEIITILNGKRYKPYVEMISYTSENNAKQYALIELVLPCGRRDVLDEISREFASKCLDRGLFKETYLGYDMDIVKHNLN